MDGLLLDDRVPHAGQDERAHPAVIPMIVWDVGIFALGHRRAGVDQVANVDEPAAVVEKRIDFHLVNLVLFNEFRSFEALF